ncbi:MAG TPA: glycine cleavage system protein GcvH [Gammaproteobacteria bacterium]|nr:glycine cleavage system protein GcvH [Gammaproteobacteria bacterium]
MSEIPTELKYTSSHEWVEDQGDGTVTLGVTDHAQDALGDLVFVELPEVGQEFEGGDACAVVESVKAASDVYAPVKSSVVEVNEELEEHPEYVNEDPYGKGWLVRLELAEGVGLDELLDAAAYQAVVEAEEE